MERYKIEKYIAEGLSSYQMAEKEQVSQSTVRHWMKKYGLKTRFQFRTGDGLREWAAKHGQRMHKNDIEWKEVQAYYDSDKSERAVAVWFKMAILTLRKAMDKGLVKKRSRQESRDLGARTRLNSNIKLTDQQKAHLSKKRKEYLTKTDRPSWQTSKYHVSRACEYVKGVLLTAELSFIEEYMPMKAQGRFFSIDIVLEDLKLGIEINGRQHYDTHGNLLPYYLERHNLIEKEGWILWEVPYSKAVSEVFVNDMIKRIKEMVHTGGVEPTTKG